MSSSFSRRNFIAGTAAIAGVAAAGRANAQVGPAHGKVVDTQVFARLEEIGEGVWGVVSTPLNPDGSFNPAAVATLCNGGIIAGEEKVVAIDGSFQPAGAAWLAEQALKLTGRPVTDVIVTHFHADHSGGLAGYQNGATGPEIIATETTNNLIFERYAGARQTPEGAQFARPVIRPVMPTRIITDETSIPTMDLGGRTIRLHPLKGHTPSDMAIVVDDANVIFAGDLVWQGLFHNYVDAIPSHLTTSVEHLLADTSRTIVTGHGAIANAGDLGNYLELLRLVEEKARASFEAGKTPAEGAKEFTVPASLGNWLLFNPRYYETAFEAWRRELAGETS
ncbi:MBL fold metallo-hydrolase [Kordiimonas aquimaris]|uniref:MBL fold metallo-hydrolase n=1 Tax=Kordiimonas aquimaris TaxID=707591 RepID=UPI0021D321DD|nr:MBL fold metallo-hydrolase [Kordiimonas aquimaris]